MKKLFFILTLATFFSISLSANATFSDVPNDAWYADEVKILVNGGGINGMPDGTFAPDSSMTKAQLVKIITAMLTDVTETEIWYEAYVNKAFEIGILNGFDQNTDWNAPVNRYEMALIASNTLAFRGENILIADGIEYGISDFEKIPANYIDSVLKAYTAKVLTGFSDKSFGGNSSLTRAEASVVAVRLFYPDTRPTASTEYSFGDPVPLSPIVDDSYFANALFLGNSLGDGFKAYSGLTQGTHQSAVGMTVYTATNYTSSATGKSSVYIMLGINEIGGNYDTLMVEYGEVIDSIRTYAPNADIYVQSVLPVNENVQSNIKNQYITDFNLYLQNLCRDKSVHYLNVHEAIANYEGYLPSNYTWDGVHLNTDVYKIWADYIRTHVAP